jgi:small-conductance mechanosensitive channel/CRP-like cAMP-binding protein
VARKQECATARTFRCLAHDRADIHVEELEILERLLLAPLFGLTAAALVGLLRGFGSLRRLRIWAMLAGVVAGALLAVRGSGVRYEEHLVQALTAALALATTAALLRLFDLILWDWFLTRRRHVTVPRLAVDLFKLLAMTAVLLLILKFGYGMELGGLLITSTVVSAVIGLAVQDMLANVAAGLGLQIEKPFGVGHWLLIGSNEGVVTQLNWRTTTLLTRDRHEVLVPNSTVAKTEVINYSRPSTLQRAHAYIGVAYRHPPGVVKAALTRAASACPEVAETPPVEVLVKSFDASAINYDIRFWINDFGRLLQITDDVYSRCWYELHRCHLEIPFPQTTVTLHTVSDEQEKKATERRRGDIFSVLRPLPVFTPLSDDQILTLVDGAELQRFTGGEALVRQGERSASLFVIRSGAVRVERTEAGGAATRIASMGAGDFFGEMSLLTGEPRTASIVAEEETEVVVVDKEAFARVLTADTGILPGLSEALESRARDTAEKVAGQPAVREEAKSAQRSSQLLRRIGHFFGLDE